MCESCERAPATQVDHITPISAGGARRDPANLQSLCHPCHSGKTTDQRAGRRWVPEKHRGCDVNGMPLDPAHPWYAPSGGRSITGAASGGTVRDTKR